MISVAPALGNAVRQATGAELTHMPIRAEDVWRAMNMQGAGRDLDHQDAGRLLQDAARPRLGRSSA